MRAPLLLLTALLAGCGGGEAPTGSVADDAKRQEEQIARQADQITRQAENGTVEIERALENEQAVVFENRENLLKAPSNAAAPANSSR